MWLCFLPSEGFNDYRLNPYFICDSSYFLGNITLKNAKYSIKVPIYCLIIDLISDSGLI